MENKLKEKYHNFDTDKLNLILTSQKGAYKVEAINAAKEVLEERGHKVDLKQLFFERYDTCAEEDLMAMVTAESGTYKSEVIRAAKEILAQRGHANTREQLFLEKFAEYYDEDLVVILTDKKEEYQVDEITAIKKILKQRGIKTEKILQENPKEEKSSVAIIITIGLFLLILIGRVANSTGDIWSTIGIILPVAIIFILIAQRK